MLPKGAAHVPYRGSIKVCKRLKIDYAEAVVDFEFGHRMAVPVIHGVVIAEEYHDEVMVEIEKDEAERRRKEDEKRRKAALGQWRKFIMGLRIVERIRQEYGEIDEKVSVFAHSKGAMSKSHHDGDAAGTKNEDMAGGFLPEGYEEEDEGEQRHTSSFFPVGDDEDGAGDDAALTVEHE
jgi:xeroderma pigmentosum group C-complementing protein